VASTAAPNRFARGNPRAVIDHADLDDVVTRLGAQSDIPVLLIGNCLRRVAQQVQQDLLDLDLVGDASGPDYPVAYTCTINVWFRIR
jgi:hypothetical protein